MPLFIGNPTYEIMNVFSIPAEVNFAFLAAIEESCLLHKTLT